MSPRETAVESLRSAGWQISPASERDSFPPALAERAHPSLISWMSAFSRLSSDDDATWFLAAADYADSGDDAFAWNEFESMSADAAASDEERLSIAAFWAEHLPILLSVRDAYAYLAVRRDGAIVHGEEPEFEQTTVIAADLDTFLRVIGDRPTPGVGVIESLLFARR